MKLNNAVQFNCSEIVRHFYMLSTSFEGYFLSRELQSVDSWIRNPFLFKLKAMDCESSLVDELIDLKNNQGLQTIVNQVVSYLLISILPINVISNEIKIQ